MELVYQHEWDTLDFEPPKADRRDFLQNPKTYKFLNKTSKQEEYYPDPLWRVAMLVAGTIGVIVIILLNMVAVLAVEVVIKILGDSLGMPAVGFLLGANVQVRSRLEFSMKK